MGETIAQQYGSANHFHDQQTTVTVGLSAIILWTGLWTVVSMARCRLVQPITPHSRGSVSAYANFGQPDSGPRRTWRVSAGWIAPT